MANQHVNKVAVNGQTVLDLSGDTVYPGMLAKGITAHDKSGAQITGTLEVPATEELTVELSMLSGNQVILPTSGKVMRKVTVQKPATLLPENIKKDVVIGGVTGTLEAGGGGGGGVGFSITFPATATNWGKIGSCAIIQADGTVIDIKDYSTVAGKTIPNVIEISCQGEYNFYILRITVQTGKIMMTYITPMSVFATIAVDGESSRTYMGNGSNARWIPLVDTVISSIEMYNTD